MRSTGFGYWGNREPETIEQSRQRNIRSLELQVADKERELSRLRKALETAKRLP